MCGHDKVLQSQVGSTSVRKPQLSHKKKDRMLVENYRPILNLVETGNLVEYVNDTRSDRGLGSS